MEDIISVMIVEDERLTLEDMLTIIDWEKCGCKVIATAFNGRQGLKKFREYKPQLIFTDIRMPFMDGIEMISEIRKEDSKVSIVLLTAYEDFGYAKAAISLGITEYMMKNEITEHTLVSLLRRLNLTITRENQRNKIVTDRMLEQFFLSGELAENPDMEDYLKKPFSVILVEQDLPISMNGERPAAEIVIPRAKIAHALSCYDYGEWRLEAITSLSGGQIVLALNIENGIKMPNRMLLQRSGEKIHCEVQKMMGCSFSVYVFSARTSLYELKRYCDENKHLFLEKYFKGSGAIHILEYPFPKSEIQEDKEICVCPEEVTQLRGEEAIEDYFEKICQGITESKNYDQLLSVSRDFYYILQKHLRRAGGRVLYEKLSQEENWQRWVDAEKIFFWFQEQFCRLDTFRKQEGHYSKPISDVIEYIYLNYQNPDLSLNTIAEHVHLSAGYLSGAFKREVGDTLKNFITDVRIEAAKRMMENGNYRIYEIGYQVGYHSSQYFSQVFYKKVGMLPTEYRKKE